MLPVSRFELVTSVKVKVKVLPVRDLKFNVSKLDVKVKVRVLPVSRFELVTSLKVKVKVLPVRDLNF